MKKLGFNKFLLQKGIQEDRKKNSTTALWITVLILDPTVKSNRKAKGKEKCALARIIWLGSPKKT